MTFSHGVVASSSMGLHESPGLQTTGRQGGFQVCGSWSRLVTSLPRCAVPGGVWVLWLCALGRGFVEGPLPQGSGHILGHWETGPGVLPMEAKEFCTLPQPGSEGKFALHSCLLPSPISQSSLRSLGFQKATAGRGEVGQFIFSHTEVGMGNLGRIT